MKYSGLWRTASVLAIAVGASGAALAQSSQTSQSTTPASQATAPASDAAAPMQSSVSVAAGATADPNAANGANTGEIVVTAQRRSEKLQNVGIAVTAFTGVALKQQGFISSLDIAKITPGVSASGTLGGQGMQFSIRGVTQSDYNDAIEAPVAVYVDDVYISSQQGQGMALYDISRVEVLKGPQGTLFGRNATGGLAQFVINKPELGKVGGYLDGTYGRFDQTTLEGALNIPLGENAAIRASGTWNRHGSIWKNEYPAGVVAGAPLAFGPQGVSPGGQNLGGENSLAGRLQLLWQPVDRLTVRLTGSAFRQNLSESPWTSSAVVPEVDAQGRVVGEIYASPTETRSAIGPNGQNFFNPAVLPFQGFQYSPNGNGQRAPGADWFGYVPVDIGKRELSKDFALSHLNTFRAYNAALHLDYDLGGMQLASVTAWSQYKKNFLLDADGSPVDGLAFGTKSNIKTFSQETRLSGNASSSIDWTTGVYYLHIIAHDAQGLLAPRGSALAAVFGMVSTGVDPMSVFTLRTDSVSLFGQANWHFADKWTFVVGARGIHEHQTYDFSSSAYANQNDYTIDTSQYLFTLQPSFHDSRNENLWAGKAQLEYRPSRGILLYFGVNRGVKAGSYNGKLFDGTPPLSPDSIPYKPEVLTSYEAGFKLTSSNGRYTLNGSAFHYQYHNYQSFVFSDISGFVQNRDARTNGGELEATARFGDIRVALSGAYLDATVKDLQIAPGVFRDTRPTYTPKFSGSANVRYTVPVDVFGGRLGFGALVTHQSDFYQNARNFAGDKFDGRTLLDLSMDWNLKSGFSLSAFLKNATDLRYKTVGLDLATACGCNLEAYGLPRTWGVTVGYKF